MIKVNRRLKYRLLLQCMRMGRGSKEEVLVAVFFLLIIKQGWNA
jgi:hypothetical protein